MEKEVNLIKGRKREPSESTYSNPGSGGLLPTKKTKGRVKIKMEFIDNKLRRYTTFSKRKTGIMKKAYELSTLTGTQVMLLVASETGHVYTFATKKLQPMITSEAGKALIQTCLNSPEDEASEQANIKEDQRMCAEGFEETEIVYEVDNKDRGVWSGVGEDGVKNEEEDVDDLDEQGSDDNEGVMYKDDTSESDLPTNLSINKRDQDSEIFNLTMNRQKKESNQQNERISNSFSDKSPPLSSSSTQPSRFLSSLITNTTSNGLDRKLSLLPAGLQISEAGLLQASPHLPAEVLAQLGYTSLLAQAQAHHHQTMASSLPRHNFQLPGSNSSPAHQQPGAGAGKEQPAVTTNSSPRLTYVLPEGISREVLAAAVAASSGLGSHQLLRTAAENNSNTSGEQLPENLSLHDKHS